MKQGDADFLSLSILLKRCGLSVIASGMLLAGYPIYAQDPLPPDAQSDVSPEPSPTPLRMDQVSDAEREVFAVVLDSITPLLDKIGELGEEGSEKLFEDKVKEILKTSQDLFQDSEEHRSVKLSVRKFQQLQNLYQNDPDFTYYVNQDILRFRGETKKAANSASPSP
jgi:hypothetical protein